MDTAPTTLGIMQKVEQIVANVFYLTFLNVFYSCQVFLRFYRFLNIFFLNAFYIYGLFVCNACIAAKPYVVRGRR